jgi:hypothetical protein
VDCFLVGVKFCPRLELRLIYQTWRTDFPGHKVVLNDSWVGDHSEYLLLIVLPIWSTFGDVKDASESPSSQEHNLVEQSVSYYLRALRLLFFTSH